MFKALEFAAKIPKPKQKEVFNKNHFDEKKPQNHEQNLHTLSKIQLLEAKHHIDQKRVQVSYSFKPHFYPQHLITNCINFFGSISFVEKYFIAFYEYHNA
jgi:hypothetical protein